MAELDAKIIELEARLESLVRTQIDFQSEISLIRRELTKLRGDSAQQRVSGFSTTQLPPPTVTEAPKQTQTPATEPIPKFSPRERSEPEPPNFGYNRSAGAEPETVTFSSFFEEYFGAARGNIEKFIGENLISKIGILILLLGVGIGAKFAIDNGWISPVMRGAAGYLLGFALIVVALKLKANYHNFSAVVMSGGLATVYIITFFAYSYYALIPMLAAFVVMVLITIATVGLAIVYERQVIAHFGLVGAYAIPFLLSTNSGNYLALFSYMAIVNIGILAVSIRKYWLSLFFTSFIATWLIYSAWILDRFSPDDHLNLALVFLGIFFAIFYVTKLIQKVVFKDTDENLDRILLIATVAVFYGLCFVISISIRTQLGFTSFFVYLASITLVVLVTSFRFYDRIVVFVVNPAVWCIFWVWFVGSFKSEQDLLLGAIFSTVYFAMFYGAAIYYRLVNDEIASGETAGLVISNSIVFYGFGYSLLDSRVDLQPLAGLFTAGHAALHSVVSQFISRFKASRVDLVQALAVLIITFATAAIPVQFDGRVVTLIWSIEAAALFWFGRARLIRLFEYFSYPIMALAIVSQLNDWVTIYDTDKALAAGSTLYPLLNGYFVSSLIFTSAFGFIYKIHREEFEESVLSTDLLRPFGIAIGAVGLFALYNALRIEIGNYYQLQRVLVDAPAGVDLTAFNVLWQINYSLLFAACLTILNIKKVRSLLLGSAGVLASILFLCLLLTVGMYMMYELRGSFMGAETSASLMNIMIRYISYGFAGLTLYAIYLSVKDELIRSLLPGKLIELGFDLILCGTLFVTTSCELLHIMSQLHIADGTKLGLSIWWALFSIAVIVAGIAWRRAHLRFGAIALLAVTLIKLFVFDVANLSTIPKTILFVSLGLLLLVVSFLYNKYRTTIFQAEDDDEKVEL